MLPTLDRTARRQFNYVDAPGAASYVLAPTGK